MRENIGLFKAKRKDNEKWVEGYYLCLHHQQLDDTDLHIIVDEHGEYHLVDSETVGEFTGLTDKNGKKIFEWDILKSFGKREIISVVEYGAFRPEFFYDCAKNMGYDIENKIYGLFAKSDGCEMMFAEDMHLAEVIGNKFDNPELLGRE